MKTKQEIDERIKYSEEQIVNLQMSLFEVMKSSKDGGQQGATIAAQIHKLQQRIDTLMWVLL